MRRIAAPRWVQRAAGWAVLVGLGVLYAAQTGIKHPPTALVVARIVLGVIALICWVALAVDAAKVARDWLWLRRQDWRDWRNRNQRAHRGPFGRHE